MTRAEIKTCLLLTSCALFVLAANYPAAISGWLVLASVIAILFWAIAKKEEDEL